MDDEKILQMGGDENDLKEYAKQNGADLEKQDFEEELCARCGGEMLDRMAGDESYRRCEDCGFVDMS